MVHGKGNVVFVDCKHRICMLIYMTPSDAVTVIVYHWVAVILYSIKRQPTFWPGSMG